jgi:hypothetical protein
LAGAASGTPEGGVFELDMMILFQLRGRAKDKIGAVLKQRNCSRQDLDLAGEAVLY